MSPIIIIIGLIVLIGLGVGAFLFIRSGDSGDKATQDRLERFVSDFEATAPEMTSDKQKADKGPGMLAKNLDQAVEGRGFARKMQTEIARADLAFTVGEYLMLVVISMVGTAALAFFIYDQNLIMTLAGAVLGFFLPRFYVGFRKSKRLKEFNGQLGDTITLMANGLRSGYSLLMAMEAVGREMPNPISGEFSRVVREISLGVPYDQAMNNMVRRIPSDDLELMITAINVQHEVGGNLSQMLEVIGEVIRERVRIQGEIKTLTAQGMMSGYVISFLPIILGLLLFAMNQEYLGRMIFQNETQPCGWIMVGIGLMMIGMGFAAIMKVVKIEV